MPSRTRLLNFFAAALLHGVLLCNPIGNHFGATALEIYHRIVKVAITAKLAILLLENLKADFHAVLEEFFDPRAHDERIAQAERPFEFDVRNANVPAVARLDELFHR